MKRVWIPLLVAAALALLAHPAQAADLATLAEAINDWQLDEARAELEALEAEGEPSAELLHQTGRYYFHAGQYKTALDALDQALLRVEDPRDRARYEQTRALVQSTYDVTKDYKEFRSPNGYFVIRIQPGKDEVLLPYAFETLEAAYLNLGQDFGYKPPAPVLVEIYPEPATLAAVSGLTELEIKTSGTIALCSYNRLMFTSPKALLKGYTWRDTLSHEFAHLAITQRSRNSVPIWMHEGLAKYEERRWRGGGDSDHLLSPSSENLLAKGVKENKLITFAEMHPSMAKLPSQEATALAFAEVYTVMEYLERQRGPDAFAQLLTAMRETGDPEQAISRVMGQPFPAFLKSWNAYLRARPTRAFDEGFVFVERLEFADGKKESELLEIGQKEARDYIHLGELLQARKRLQAAVEEYEKARTLVGDRNPILQTRLGRTLLTLGDATEAVDVLKRSLEYYPTYFNTHLLLGEGYLALKDYPQAEAHLIEAIGINPFDPAVHESLSRLYQATSRPELAQRATEHARRVGGGPR